MPLSTVKNYLRPDDAEVAYLATAVQLTPTGRMPYRMRAVRIELEGMWLHQVDELSPRIKQAAHSPDRVFTKFLATPGQDLVIDGASLPYEGLLRHSLGHSYYDRTFSPVRWASTSLPVERLASAETAIGGRDLLPLRNSVVATPRAGAMTRLRQLHAAASALAQDAPWVIAAPEVVHSLEQSLLEALVGCLDQSEAKESSWGQRRHETIMRKFRDILECNPDRPAYVPEICEAIRVPERTLRLCCQEHLGMSPKRYLLLRRMNQAHRALDAAIATETTVTEVATCFGFWHFGRFAGTYRSIFGELPSVTLHKPPG